MNPDTYAFLDIDLRDGVAFVVFNGSDPENRFDPRQRTELHRLPREAAAEDAVRVLVFTGAGEHFTGGGDHSKDGPFEPLKSYERSLDFLRSWLDFDKPTIMAINGPAKGLGLAFAILGDIVIAERHVTFGDTHVLSGLAGPTGPWLWPSAIGLRSAKRYLLTGDSFGAEEAQQMGLITEVADHGQAIVRANEYATKLAALRPEALRYTKRMLNRSLRMTLPEIIEHGLALELLSFPETRPW